MNTFIVWLIYVVTTCRAADPFGSRIPQGKVTDADIVETSGLAVSRVHSGVIYTHNDMGDSSRFFAVDIKSGDVLATFKVNNAANYDWEDFAYGPCVDDCENGRCRTSTTPSRYCIYIADIGDHSGDGAHNVIYMVREPSSITDSDIDFVNTLEFSWTEQDAETLLVSPVGELFVISKIYGGRAFMAPLPNSAWGQGRVSLDMGNTATLKITTTKNDPQGGAISPDGKEMVIVSEEGAYYYSIPNGDYLDVVRTTVPEKIGLYEAEPSTEAITWSPDGQGFYTLPEGDHQRIYFYPRTGAPIVG